MTPSLQDSSNSKINPKRKVLLIHLHLSIFPTRPLYYINPFRVYYLLQKVVVAVDLQLLHQEQEQEQEELPFPCQLRLHRDLKEITKKLNWI